MQNQKTKLIVHCDMDGPLCNFEKGVGRDYVGWDPPEMLVPGFFRNLEEVPGSRKAIEILSNHPNIDLYITTKPTFKALTCATEKLQWIEEKYPYLLKKTNIVCDKTIFLAGDFLIDDDKRWEGFKGTFIHFDKEHPQLSWKHAVDLILDNA